MNMLGGARRIKFVGKTAVRSGFLVMLFSILSMFALRHTDLALYVAGAENISWITAAVGLCLLIVGSLLRVLGWILEGFGLPRTQQKM